MAFDIGGTRIFIHMNYIYFRGFNFFSSLQTLQRVRGQRVGLAITQIVTFLGLLRL